MSAHTFANSTPLAHAPARADIYLAHIRHNAQRVRECINGEAMMAIVKADAYGHGRARVAQTLAPDVEYLGVAQLSEALLLRKEIDSDTPILSWMYAPGAPFAEALEARIELSLGAFWAVNELEATCRASGKSARVHLKVDTGMARGGFNLSDLEEASRRLRALEAEGLIEVVGLWSHLARADEPELPTTCQQIERFEWARQKVRSQGLQVQLHHLAASAGTLWHPKARYDMVRPGIVLYGLSPNPEYATAKDLGLQAAMELSAELIVERTVPEATGISYGHTETTLSPTHLGVVPLGYADGIPRAASSRAPVSVRGKRVRVRGRVCMDQFVIDIPDTVQAGEKVVLFGPEGCPSADEWGQACGTIGYEIVTRIGPRVPRNYHE